MLILIVGFSYAVLFGGMSLLRGEGFSMQFTLEAVALTVFVTAGGLLTGSVVNPILFLVFIYVITMRSRLLVDVATLFSNRGRQRQAISILQTALRLFPDKQTRLIVLVNMGIVQLRRENPQSAQTLFETVLEDAKEGGLGIRHRAACHYNLAVALQQQGADAKAVRHFREAADGYPGSLYSKAAQKALDQRRRGKKGAVKTPSADERE
ncbi:MAG: tetratricopeptide repeat protein [Anaerolineales bacterium]|nr:tetratricopeptide repeat protein [Anaerolineales bacterium]